MKLTERDLVSIIKAHRADSLGAEDGDVSDERAKAMDHYHGRPYGNEVAGRSQVVSRDLSETVDWAMPAIIRAFVQSGNLGEFTPVGPEDEQQAQQETDYTNQVLMKDNPGFMILHDSIKDTMLLKNGYVKHFWEKSEKITEEDYEGLSIDQVQKLFTDLESDGAEVTVKGQSVELKEGPDGVPYECFTLKLQIKRDKGKFVWMAVPTEEVRVSKKCRGSLQESPFVEHVTKKTRSELIEMGLSREYVDDLPALKQTSNDNQRYSRDSTDNETDDFSQESIDRSMDEIEYGECYLRVDWDGDGIAELRKVVTLAETRIPPGEKWNEPIEACALTGLVMKRVPHRHIGESLDDELADLQEIKTTLNRQMLDNIYLINNPQIATNERANLRDLMTVTPGGIKRFKGTEPIAGSVMPLTTPSMVGDLLTVAQYWDKTKEIRTGIRPGSDMDPDMLKEITKGAYLESLNRASQKIEMMARMLAEGVKEAFLQAHAILIRHQNKSRIVQLRGKWVPVNPQEWRERTDLTIRVGLGTGNEEEKRQKLMMLSGLQMQLLQACTQAPPPVYARMYALFEDLCKSVGVETPEKYAIAPNGPEYQQLQQQLAQQRQQTPNPEMAKVQMQAQLEQQRMQMQQQTDRNRQEMEAQQQQAKLTMEMELEKAKAQMSMELEAYKARVKAEVDQIIARMNNAAKLDVAQINAQTTLTAQQEAASDSAAQD